MDQLELTERVIRFVAEQTRTRIDRIDPSSRLSEDLGVDGADGWELIEKYAGEFGVDLTGIDYRNYFGPEAAWTVEPLFRFVAATIRLARGQGWSYHPWDPTVPITIQDLVESVQAGRWLHPGV